MSYIISKDNKLIAKTPKPIRSGESVLYAYDSSSNKINANRSIDLVDARVGTISNAKKWNKVFDNSFITEGLQISDNEFLVFEEEEN
jgi:hypothetical protein